jgi:CubicO group peptidase (beta-lactamase class C family)
MRRRQPAGAALAAIAAVAAAGLLLVARPRPLPVAPALDARLVTLDSVAVRAEEMPRLTSLIVIQHGRTVLERYYRGMTADRAVNVKSISKTLLSPLVGIAIRDGYLRGADQPVAEILTPPLAPPLADGKRQITLAHLLTMTAGLEGTSFDQYGPWVASRNWVRNALERPLVCPPGSCWEYSTGNTHLLSAALTRATGRSTLAYARAVLFDPLGITLPPWDRDPQGIYLGGNNMRLRPRDLATIGQLYLDGGRADGRQIVPEEWIRASWQPQVTSPWNGYDYGYLWWSRELAGERVHFAWGYGGQFLFVLPRLDATVVATSDLNGLRESGQNREVHRFMGRYVIPVLRQEPLLECGARSAECGAAASDSSRATGAPVNSSSAIDRAAPR